MGAPVYQDDTRRQLLLAALVAATASIPLLVNVNSIALILFVVACLVQQPWRSLKQKLAVPSLWVIPCTYFLWTCCSYFWDVTGGFAVRDVERYAVLFFIPPALAAVPAIPPRFIKITGAVFIAVTAAVCVCCLVKSFGDYRLNHDSRVFFYHYLSQQMDLNAIFLSNYCLAGILWLLYYGFLGERKRASAAYAIIILLSLFLFAMILLLSSKLIIFLTLLMLLFFVLYIGYIRHRFFPSLTVIVLMVALGIGSVSHLGYVKWRISETSLKTYSGLQDNNNGLSIRVLMWNTAWDLVKRRPLLGYGARGARTTVLEKYREENFMMGYEAGYHSHNQYLQSALMGGIPAFLLLMAMLLRMGWKGLKERNMLLLMLLFHFVCQSVIESTFEVQQELVFYVLFLFLFYYHPLPVVKKDRRIREQ